MTTDTMAEIKNKLKRKQNKEEEEENINLIEREREKIIEQIKEHIKTFYHTQCKEIDEIVIVYNLFKGARVASKQDPITLIVHPNVQGLPKK